MKKSKATKTEVKTAAKTPETKTAAKTSVKAKYVLAKDAETGKYAESSHAGAVIKVLKGGKKMTSGEISDAIESGKLLKDSAMSIGKATSWILWKLKQKEVVVNA
jgi:DNA recombination-dependent growth factor C